MIDCGKRIREVIAAEGPIPVAEYMRIALGDPECGYYVRRNPISGDFITAPEISQIFGELIGLFFVQLWLDRGSPPRFRLVEFGPGRGTLIADILRAARVRPDFLRAAELDLIEISPVLRETQRLALRAHRVRWHEKFDAIASDAPVFIIANEFFDALPVRQFVSTGGFWHERKVGLDGEQLCFTVDPDAVCREMVPVWLRQARDGDVYEFSDEARHLAQDIAARVAITNGAALIIDYGHDRSGLADTLQAVHAHHYADPLEAPGESDLTCHVDFATLAMWAESRGARVHGPVGQGAFLQALGIRERAAILKRNANDHAGVIESGVERLTAKSQMGALFKVLGLSAPGAPVLPGFF